MCTDMGVYMCLDIVALCVNMRIGSVYSYVCRHVHARI